MNELLQSEDALDLTQLKNMLRLRQQIEVLSKLEEICHKIEEGEKNFAVYSDGFNDKVAASMISRDLGFLVTPTNVSKVRREMIGDLRKPNTKNRGIKGRLTDSENRITDLQRQVVALHELVAELRTDLTAHTTSVLAHGREAQGLPFAVKGSR